MKKNIPLIAVCVLAIASIAAVSVSDSNNTTLALGGIDSQTGIDMYGHVTLVASDSQGQIKSYVQTDNAIVDEGTNCILQALFANSTGCTGDIGTFNAIAIGNGTDEGADANTGNFDKFGDTGLDLIVVDSNIITVDGTTQGNATISGSWTNNDPTTGNTVTEAILVNSTAGTSFDANTQALAYQHFTAIPLDTSDSLAIEWTITVTEG